nr:putative ribonuclease H-like domain-containing protein [Tanacetum cinerariifolium]
MSLDDLYNHLKVYEFEVQKKSEPNSQNMAFISSAKHSSGNEEVNITNGSTASINVSTGHKSNDEDDMEEMDIKWNMALLSMRADRFWKKTGKKISIQGTNVAGFDKSKFECFNCHKMGHFAPKALMEINRVGWDWSYMANDKENHALVADEEDPTKFALMAKTSIESGVFDNSLCFKAWLAQVEARLAEHKNQDLKYCKKLRILEFKTESRANCIQSLTKDLELLKKEKGYSVVPPPAAQVYSPPKKDMSWTGLPEFKDDTVKKGTSRSQNNTLKSFTPRPAVHKPYKPPMRPMRSNMNVAWPNRTSFNKPAQSYTKRPFQRISAVRSQYRAPWVPTVNRNFPSVNRKFSTVNRKFSTANRKFPTGGTKFSTADMGKKGKAIKASAFWFLKPLQNLSNKGPNSNSGSSHNNIDDKGYWDSGCSRNMTGNISYLSDYESFDEGYVSFSQGGCKITGKETIKTSKLKFENVYFVKDLKYNLFSVSQIYDNKNSVLFTDSECIVLGRDFKLLDDANVLLRTLRQHNMYSIDLNNIVPHKDLTCLVTKASTDEGMLWHRRLSHLNFKTMNKLVRQNLVRGLPTKCFKNDHTYTACLKGKQHKASCKSKLVNSVTKPLHTLHIDLFSPTYVSSISHKWYCLVVTDDFFRFTWTFFLKTKDETSGILRKFITEIENLKDLKVKITRYDNGGEFRNKEMNDFCSQKGIKREFSNARTPQQNGVAKRRNRRLIEAARTMLADAKLLVTFWAKVVNTACYVQNRVLVNKSQNKTPYELFNGRTPAIGFLKPFGCHVMILNTLDNLGKFEAKWDEGTNSTNLSGTKDAASQEVKKDVSYLRYIALPNWVHDALLESSLSKPQDDCSTDVPKSSGNSNPTATSTNPSTDQMETLTVETPIPTVSSPVPTACFTDSQEPLSDTRLISKRVANQVETPSLDNVLTLINRFEDILGFTTNSDESNGVEADVSNMKTTITASPTPTLRIHKDHPKSQIISPVDTLIQTRNKSKENVWTLVDCPKGVRPIGTKWVLKNKKDERGIVIRNKARLVAQGHIQEEGIDYDEVFALVARIEAIILFLAYASFMGFSVNQIDDPEFPTKVYKVEKAMYGLHQAPGAWLSMPCEALSREISSSILHFNYARLAFCDYHNMVAILEKSEHNVDFHPIVDFVEASPLRYALTFKPTVYVSHIRQFWSTAMIETTEEGTKILATIYSNLRTVFESSIRRNLKLNDEAGISSLPDAELFENLTLMGYNISPNQKFTFQKGQFSHQWKYLIHTIMQCLSPKSTGFNKFNSNTATALGEASDEPASPLRDVSKGEACPTDSGFEVDQDRANIAKSSILSNDSAPRVTSLAADEGSMQQKLDELTSSCTSLQRQHSEMVVKFEAQELEINSLKARIKVLEDREGGFAEQSRDDAPIKGRRLDVGEEAAERVSDDTEEMVTVLTSMDAATVLSSEVAEVSTCSGSILIDGPPTTEVPTGSDVVPTAGLISATATVMARHLEEEMEREAQRMNEQIARDVEIARIHTKEELQIMIDGLDRNNETIAKYLGKRFKRKGIRFEQESVKKLKTLEEVKATEEVPEEKVKEMMQLVPVEEVYVEALQFKHLIIDWKVYTEEHISYWKITRLGGSSASYQFFMEMLKHLDKEDLNQLWRLVKESLSIRPPTNDKEMELWVELKRLYEPDDED